MSQLIVSCLGLHCMPVVGVFYYMAFILMACMWPHTEAVFVFYVATTP